MRLTNKLVKLFLVGIVVLAAVLRLWNLGSTPPSLDWDEASWGYNAYSILHTGHDEYGKAFPVVLRSFNDYKPALYAYLDIPFIASMGLNNWSVRLPDAIFGILTVFTTYFLVKEMFGRRDLALLSAFLLAISPWSIQFSRFTHEGIVGLELNLLMVLFFLKSIKNPWFLSLSTLFAALSLYSYQNEKLFVPLLALILVIIYRKQLIKINKRYLVSAFIVGFLVSFPLLYYTVSNPSASLMRAKGASFLNSATGVLNLNFYPERKLVDQNNNDVVGLIMDNRRLLYAKDIINNYLSHFDPNFLFVTGERIGRHEPPGMAHLYLIELPFLLLGLYWLISRKELNKKVKTLILAWILIVPIPAAFTWDVPNAGRTINFLPTFQILTAIGLLGTYEYLKLKNKMVRYLSVAIFIFFALFNFSYYLNSYFVQYNYFNSEDFQYGYNLLIPEVQKNYDSYKKIIVSNEMPLDQSYIFFLFYLKYPPSLYQQNSSSGKYETDHAFDKYIFTKLLKDDGKIIPSSSGNLYVVGANKYSEIGNRLIKRINFLDGSPAYVIYTGL